MFLLLTQFFEGNEGEDEGGDRGGEPGNGVGEVDGSEGLVMLEYDEDPQNAQDTGADQRDRGGGDGFFESACHGVGGIKAGVGHKRQHVIEDALEGGIEGDMLQTADGAVYHTVQRKEGTVQKEDEGGEKEGDGDGADHAHAEGFPYTGYLFGTCILPCEGDGAKVDGVDGGEGEALQIGGGRVAVDDGLIVVAHDHHGVVDLQNGGLDEKRIFERFYQGAQKKEGSTGLGLAIVEAICRQSRLKIRYQYVDGWHRFVLYR